MVPKLLQLSLSLCCRRLLFRRFSHFIALTPERSDIFVMHRVLIYSESARVCRGAARADHHRRMVTYKGVVVVVVSHILLMAPKRR